MTVDGSQQQKGSRSRIANYQKILENNPKSFIFAQLAEEHLKLDEVDLAIEICREGLKHNPNFSDGLYVLGVAVYKKGQKETAVHLFVRILSNQPDHFLAREALHRMGFDDEWIAARAAEVPAGEELVLGAEEDTEYRAEPEKIVVPNSQSEEKRPERHRTQITEETVNRSSQRSVPFASGDIRSAVRPGQAAEDDAEESTRKPLPQWAKITAIIAIPLLLLGVGFGIKAYLDYRKAQDIAARTAQAETELKKATTNGHLAATVYLEDALLKYPDHTGIKAMLILAYAQLLIDAAPGNRNWQGRMEALKSLLPPEDQESLTFAALGYRSFALGEAGQVRFNIDSAQQKGRGSHFTTCLDAELHAYDRDYPAAIKLFDDALNAGPGWLRPMVKKAETQVDARDFAGAKITLDLLLEKDPKHLTGRILLWETQLNSGTSARDIEASMGPLLENEAKDLQPSPQSRLLSVRSEVEHLLGRDDKALEFAQQAVALLPRPESLFRLAGYQFAKGLAAEAKTSVNKAIEMNSDEKRYHALLGRIFFTEDRKTEALKQLEMAIDESTDDPELLVMAGDAANKLKMFEKAVQYYERASFVNIKNLDIKKKLILTLIERQDMKEAQQRIERLLLDNPEDPTAYFLSGRYLIADGKEPKALKEYEKGLKLDPTNRDILLDLIKGHFSKGEIERGVGLLHRLEEKYPDDPEVLGPLADVAFAAEALTEARYYLERLAKIQPQLPAHRLRLAYLDHLEGRTEVARKFIEAEAAKDPNQGLAQIMSGVLALAEKDPKKAENLVQKGVQLESKSPEGHYWLGKIKAAANDTTWAMNEFELALECQALYPKARYEIGMLHLERGAFSQAKDQFTKALEIFELFPGYKDYPVKIMLRLAEIEFAQNHKSQGMDLVRKAMKAAPSLGEPYYLMARESDKYRRWREAVKLLDKAEQLDPDLHAVAYERGLIYLSLERKKEAMQAFRNYLARDPKGCFAFDAKKQIEFLEGK